MGFSQYTVHGKKQFGSSRFGPMIFPVEQPLQQATVGSAAKKHPLQFPKNKQGFNLGQSPRLAVVHGRSSTNAGRSLLLKPMAASTTGQPTPKGYSPLRPEQVEEMHNSIKILGKRRGSS